MISPLIFHALSNNGSNTTSVSDLSLGLYARILQRPQTYQDKAPAAQLLVKIAASFYDFHKMNAAVLRGVVDGIISEDEFTSMLECRDRRAVFLGQSPFDVHLQHHISLILDEVEKVECYEQTRNHDMAFHSYAKLGELAYMCCFFDHSSFFDTDRARRNWLLCEGRAFLLNMYHLSEEGDCHIYAQTIVSRLGNDGSRVRVRNSIFYYEDYMIIPFNNSDDNNSAGNNSGDNHSEGNNSEGNNSVNNGEDGSNSYFASAGRGDNGRICAHFPPNNTSHHPDCKCDDESMLHWGSFISTMFLCPNFMYMFNH